VDRGDNRTRFANVGDYHHLDDAYSVARWVHGNLADCRETFVIEGRVRRAFSRGIRRMHRRNGLPVCAPSAQLPRMPWLRRTARQPSSM